jgi:hypothetical protein
MDLKKNGTGPPIPIFCVLEKDEPGLTPDLRDD